MSATFYSRSAGILPVLERKCAKLFQSFSRLDFTPDVIRAVRSGGQDARAPTRNQASFFSRIQLKIAIICESAVEVKD